MNISVNIIRATAVWLTCLSLLIASSGLNAENRAFPEMVVNTEATPEAYSGLEVIDLQEMDGMRGGFSFGGLELKFGATLSTLIDSIKLETVFNITSHGTEIVSQVLSNLAAVNEAVAALASQSPALTSTSSDSSTSTVTGPAAGVTLATETPSATQPSVEVTQPTVAPSSNLPSTAPPVIDNPFAPPAPSQSPVAVATAGPNPTAVIYTPSSDTVSQPSVDVTQPVVAPSSNLGTIAPPAIDNPISSTAPGQPPVAVTTAVQNPTAVTQTPPSNTISQPSVEMAHPTAPSSSPVSSVPPAINTPIASIAPSQSPGAATTAGPNPTSAVTQTPLPNIVSQPIVEVNQPAVAPTSNPTSTAPPVSDSLIAPTVPSHSPAAVTTADLNPTSIIHTASQNTGTQSDTGNTQVVSTTQTGLSQNNETTIVSTATSDNTGSSATVTSSNNAVVIGPDSSVTLSELAPVDVKLDGLESAGGFSGLVINDNKGFTAAVHKLTQEAAISAVISNASSLKVSQKLNIKIEIQNAKSARLASMRAALSKMGIFK